jgi:hypothetical protein
MSLWEFLFGATKSRGRESYVKQTSGGWWIAKVNGHVLTDKRGKVRVFRTSDAAERAMRKG